MPEKFPFQNPEIPKPTESLEREGALELKPLAEKEKKELDGLFEKLSEASGQLYYECRWQIVEKFGERVIPYLIENLEKQKISSSEYFEKQKISSLVNFFDTLVTEKTAPMVLEAMKKGKVALWVGAISS